MFVFTTRRLDEYLISVLLALGFVALLAGTARGEYRVVNRTDSMLQVAVFEPEAMGRTAGGGWQYVAPRASAVVSTCAEPVIGLLVRDQASGLAYAPAGAMGTTTRPVYPDDAFTVAEGAEPLGLIRLTWGTPPAVRLIPRGWSEADLPPGWSSAEVAIVPSDGTFEVAPAAAGTP